MAQETSVWLLSEPGQTFSFALMLTIASFGLGVVLAVVALVVMVVGVINWESKIDSSDMESRSRE